MTSFQETEQREVGKKEGAILCIWVISAVVFFVLVALLVYTILSGWIGDTEVVEGTRYYAIAVLVFMVILVVVTILLFVYAAKYARQRGELPPSERDEAFATEDIVERLSINN